MREDGRSTTAECDKSLITRISVKMVAEHYYVTALYSAVDTNCMVVAADPLSWITQWFGVLMWAEGPAAAYLATSLKQAPGRVPERPSGESLDTLRLTLQTREQHTRLNTATSNVCTAPEVNMSAMNAVDHRRVGLKNIAKREELTKLGIDTVLFDDLTLSSVDQVKTLEAKHIDEMHYTEDAHIIIDDLKETEVKGMDAVDGKVPETFARMKLYLQQHIFNFMHLETEMMRYMTSLQHKDLFLTITMISLGSCAMKVNSVESLTTCSWTEVRNTQSLALASNREMLNFLEAYRVPEYADLLTIRKYQESIGKGHGNVCIIPKSAHGMNPDSKVMPHISMKIRRIDDSQGVPIEELGRTRLENEDVTKIKRVAVKSCKEPALPGGMVDRTSSLKLSAMMLGWTRLTRTVNVWRRTTPSAKRRSARRKTRPQSRPTSTISTHAREDDDIARRSPGLRKDPRLYETRAKRP